MTPKEYKEMMAYLTRSGVRKQVKFASDLAKPDPKPIVKEIELFNAFNKRNPRADGGMLVQPSADGSRPGYAGVKAPTKKQLEIAEKVHGNKYDKTGIDLWESLEQFERSNIRQGKTTGETAGLGKLKKNQIGKDDFINLVNQNKDKTYNEFVEILKDYRTKDNKPFTKNIIADRLRDYGLSGSFQKKPALGRSEASKERNRAYTRERYREMIKTEEGRAKIKEQKQKQKAKEYQIKGLDPQAKTADEAIFKDAVATAKNNVDGKGRFSIVSGYEKSMKGKDFFSSKIKIKDNQTGKTFTYNTFKKYVNKNSKSFGIKNYGEAIKPYRQKFFINDIPNLRNNINSVLIPGWTGGDPRTAFTVQHDFGRQRNPLKTSLAFFDDNTKEYKIRSDFETAWEKSKVSKTPLADKKKAFNVFKEDIAKLNIQSSPSMIARERFFGKELDLTKAIRMAKDQGAKIPQGTFKKAAKFEQEILQDIVSYSKKPKCKINLKSEGGRIGFALSDECIRDGLNEQKIAAQQGDKKAARQLVKTAGIATRGKLLKNVLGPGALLGEAMIEGAIIGNKVLGGKPADIAYAESYLSYLDPRKYRGELDPLKMAREDMLTREVEDSDGNIKTINAPGFSALKSGFEAQDQLSAFNKAIEDRNLAKARGRIDQYIPAAADAREQGARADQSANIISSDSFKDASRLAQEYLQGQTGANMAKYRTDDFGAFESGRDKDLRRRRMQEMSDIMPRDFLTEKTSDLLDRTQYLRSLGYDISTKDLMAEQERLRSIPLSQAAEMYSPEQVYGTQGKFAGGGIAKLAGVSSGPPPESGPNSQGLPGLLKRVRNL